MGSVLAYYGALFVDRKLDLCQDEVMHKEYAVKTLNFSPLLLLLSTS